MGMMLDKKNSENLERFVKDDNDRIELSRLNQEDRTQVLRDRQKKEIGFRGGERRLDLSTVISDLETQTTFSGNTHNRITDRTTQTKFSSNNKMTGRTPQHKGYVSNRAPIRNRFQKNTSRNNIPVEERKNAKLGENYMKDAFSKNLIKRAELIDGAFRPDINIIVGSYTRVRIKDFEILEIKGVDHKKPYKAGLKNIDVYLKFVLNGENLTIPVTYVSNTCCEPSEVKQILDKQIGTIRRLKTSLSGPEREQALALRKKLNQSGKDLVRCKINVIKQQREALDRCDKKKALALNKDLMSICEKYDQKKKMEYEESKKRYELRRKQEQEKKQKED